MTKRISTYFIMTIAVAIMASCSATKSTSDNEKTGTEKPKKDNYTYNLMGKSIVSARQGILTNKKFTSQNGTFKVSVDGAAQQVAPISYLMLEEVFEKTITDEGVTKKYIKDDFSLEYLMNGERQLSYELGQLNGVEIAFVKDESNTWQIANKENLKSEILSLSTVEESAIAQFQTGTTVKLDKPFYPAAVKVGDSWTVQANDLRWILDGFSSNYEGSGTMTLNSVGVTPTDSIAIIDFTFNINYVSVFNNASPPLKKQLAFKGVIKRSLIDFVDKEITMEGTYHIARVIPKRADIPKLDVDIQATGKFVIMEEVLLK
jgi:hypothetical protein